MTVIVGMVDGDEMVFGSDSFSVDGSEWIRHRTPKIWQHGPLMFGVSGSHRLLLTLRYTTEFPFPDPTDDKVAWMIRTLMPALKAAVAEHGGADKDGELEGTILIGFAGSLFRTDNTYSVVELDVPYEVIGCGGQYALGALYRSNGDMESRVRDAIETAIYYDTNCGGQIVIRTYDPEFSNGDNAERGDDL